MLCLRSRNHGRKLEDERVEVLRHPIAIPESRLSREVFSPWKRRKKVHDIESSLEGMIIFSISGKFHGRMYASASVPLSQSIFSLFFSFSSGHRSSLEAHTKLPYTLTLKFNGCIIFIAAISLSDSYHFKAFLGTRPGCFRKPCSGWRALAPSSFRAGREDNRGSRLHYPQFCDDSFEEHVLSYSAEKAGLHLHGLNECSKDFKTQSTAVVDEFAREWGLIVTAS
jgi:hypothetical protein